jgi:hypothetical protein
MSRTGRLLVLAVAWVAPTAWLLAALLAGPSDGTSLTSSVLPPAGNRWTDSVTVARAYGDTALRPNDVVLTVDGRTLAEWVADGARERDVGEVVVYEVRRAGTGLDRNQQVDVTLTHYSNRTPQGAAPGPVPSSPSASPP